MRIEKLTPPTRPGGHWRAQLEDGSSLRVSEGCMADFALYTGMELDEETLEALKTAALDAALREKAVAMLTARPLSEGEVIRRLREKGADEQQAEEIAAWCRRIGLVNDREYAKTVVRHYQAKGYGRYKIKDELYRRRVPRSCWEEALAEMEEPDEEIDRFLAARLTDPEDRKAVKKVSDALARRGFSWEEVAAGIRRFREEHR